MNDLTAYTVLRNLLTDTAPFTGERFLKVSAKSFARQFSANFVFIAQALETPTDTVRMLAAWRGAREIDGWEFALPGTPCELIYRDELDRRWDGMRVGSMVAIADNVCDRFAATRHTTYQAFIGVPLWQGDGKMIGHVALFFDRCLTDRRERNFMLELAELFSYKVQAELNRMLLEKAREGMLEELKKANERLARDSITDSLTQLYNRRYFNQRMQQAFARFTRSGERYALALLDIDYFKQINDTHGHDVGDEVLRKAAAALSENTRAEVEVLFRIGGEEFAILCHGLADAEALSSLGNRINRLMKTISFKTGKGEFRTTVSIGTAVPKDGDASWDALYVRADTALYAAKKDGRDRTVVAS
jgi:diguanylate cyclase (GGDEF)-like protein